jgi:hypothetical protein
MVKKVLLSLPFSKVKNIYNAIKLIMGRLLPPRYFLISHFCKGNSTFVVFMDKHGASFVYEVSQISRQKEFINRLSPRDAHLLGYLLANEEEKTMSLLTH